MYCVTMFMASVMPQVWPFQVRDEPEWLWCLFLATQKTQLSWQTWEWDREWDWLVAKPSTNSYHSCLFWPYSYRRVSRPCQISPLRACTMGVTQGSILGPLLFSLYINDLPAVRDGVETLMYVDDTVLYARGKNADIVVAKLSTTMPYPEHRENSDHVLLKKNRIKVSVLMSV